jgi:hypothetical protein
VFNRNHAYRDKKVVGVFVQIRAGTGSKMVESTLNKLHIMKTNLPVTNLLFSYSGYRQHGFAMQMFNNQIQTIQSKYKEISNETVRFGSKTAS